MNAKLLGTQVARAARPLGLPAPAPRPGLSPRTPNLRWLLHSTLRCHASVVPKSRQQTSIEVQVWTCFTLMLLESHVPKSQQQTSIEVQVWKCFTLILLESQDASGEHNGGMSVSLLFVDHAL